MCTGKRMIKWLVAVLTAVIVLAQTVCVYAEEISGTVRVNDFLNVREGADDDAEIVEVLHNGDKVTIVGREGDWYKVSGDHNGYVHSGYVAIDGEQEEQQAASEEVQQQEQTQEQVQEQEQPQTQEAEAPQQTTENNSNLSDEEIRLMAALVACECGAGSYDGKLAVACVVMNRARIYGGVKNAIYAPGQFGPASSGKLAATLAVNAIDAVSLQAARDAANGSNNIGTAIHFRNVNCGHPGIVAGNHVFW